MLKKLKKLIPIKSKGIKFVSVSVDVDNCGDRKLKLRQEEQKDKVIKEVNGGGDIYPAKKQDINEKKIETIDKQEEKFDIDEYDTIKLTPSEEDKIAKCICENIKDSINNSSNLISKLDKWNDMYEGTPDP